MKILGIDPGTRVVGYGLIELKGTTLNPLACGLIRPPQNDPLSQRLRNIHDNIYVVLKRTRPDVVAVEEIFFGRNVATLIKIGEARGVILSACAAAGVEVAGHSPAEVKKAVTGNGRAAKSQVREMVAVLLGKKVSMETDDVSDALAIAICHANRARLKEIGIA
ncbi:MAG: crossover junction endodeoxyribonuclease RuvC [Planctomycetota bacterium]|jgi:crossover junction endodeoxyribonuclease RuvC